MPRRHRWFVGACVAVVRGPAAREHRGDRGDGARQFRGDAGQGRVAGLPAAEAVRARPGTLASRRLRLPLRAGVVLHHAVRRGSTAGAPAAPDSPRWRGGCGRGRSVVELAAEETAMSLWTPELLTGQPASVGLLRHFVGGAFVESASRFAKASPVTGEQIFDVCEADSSTVDAAVAAARRAVKGPWGRMSEQDRAAVLRRVADGLERRGGGVGGGAGGGTRGGVRPGGARGIPRGGGELPAGAG